MQLIIHLLTILYSVYVPFLNVYLNLFIYFVFTVIRHLLYSVTDHLPGDCWVWHRQYPVIPPKSGDILTTRGFWKSFCWCHSCGWVYCHLYFPKTIISLWANSLFTKLSGPPSDARLDSAQTLRASFAWKVGENEKKEEKTIISVSWEKKRVEAGQFQELF